MLMYVAINNETGDVGTFLVMDEESTKARKDLLEYKDISVGDLVTYTGNGHMRWISRAEFIEEYDILVEDLTAPK